jgi:ankyrin repeat protein
MSITSRKVKHTGGMFCLGRRCTRRRNVKTTPLIQMLQKKDLTNDEIMIHINNLNETDSHGNTPCHIAAKMNRVNALQEMIIYDANFDEKNNEGRTPLSYAAEESNFECFKLLFEGNSYLLDENSDEEIKQADPLSEDNKGKTPIDYLPAYIKTALEGKLVSYVKPKAKKNKTPSKKNSPRRNTIRLFPLD